MSNLKLDSCGLHKHLEKQPSQLTKLNTLAVMQFLLLHKGSQEDTQRMHP